MEAEKVLFNAKKVVNDWESKKESYFQGQRPAMIKELGELYRGEYWGLEIREENETISRGGFSKEYKKARKDLAKKRKKEGGKIIGQVKKRIRL
jgi:hypothetical protein